MDEALAFVGETGPYVQNGVVRARNIFAELEAAGHPAVRQMQSLTGRLGIPIPERM